MRMRREGRRRLARLLLISAAALLAGAGARAANVTSYLVIQPIDVCSTTGPTGTTGCAPFNTLSKSPNPTTATATTPIGFVDTTTNINLTRAIWLQAGIDVTFLPMAEYNNTTDQTIQIDCSPRPAAGSPCAGSLISPQFKAVSTGTASTVSGCTYDCAPPLAPKTANALNMFFVNSISPVSGSGLTGTFNGFAWINNNGVAIAKPTFFPSLGHPVFDTMAHEIGHNLNLDHSIYGAGDTFASGPGVACATSPNIPNPGGCNVMDAGSIRIVPASTGCTAQSAGSTTSNGGLLYDLDTGLCGVTPPLNPIADQLVLGDGTSSYQAGQALLSGFLNPIANVSANAGGGDAAAAVNPSAGVAAASSSSGIPFSISDNGGGRDSQGEFINNVIIALAGGLDISGSKAFTFISGAPVKQVIKLNGNNGENTNCAKPVGLAPPSIHCIEIIYQPGTFVQCNTAPCAPGTFDFSQFTLNITKNDKPLTDPSQVAGSQFTVEFETDANPAFPGTNPIALFATTGDFQPGFSPFANSQNPDPSVASVILNPLTFTGTVNSQTGTQSPCQPVIIGYTETETPIYGCPDQAGGDPTGPD